jgi:hypothetical protein
MANASVASPRPTGSYAAPNPVASNPVPASQRAPNTGSTITGPSFLGLNTPTRGRGESYEGSDGNDSLRPSSGNLDYLLEDEEEPKRGWGKLILGLVALALAVGFGYLHFKQGGFDFLKTGDRKTATTSETAPGGADSGSANGTGTTPEAATPQAGAGSATVPATGGAAARPADSNAGQTGAAQSDSQNSSQAAAPANSQATTPATTPTGSAVGAVDGSPAGAASGAPSGSGKASAGDGNAAAEAGAEPASSDSEKPLPARESPAQPKLRASKPAAAKPSAAIKAGDSVSEAERYIYGRGVRQDCDRGLRMLKAEQANPKAMILLGGLYSAGTCAPRDLPTAYRWFALALHKQPDNAVLQDDLQKLWSQMTAPERQLAIKLSQ